MEIEKDMAQMDFKQLIENASSVLKLSCDELINNYKDYPIYITEYIENEVHEHYVKIRFDKPGATLSCYLNEKKSCNHACLLLDTNSNEDLFIDHLIDNADYNFKKSSWLLNDCYLKIKECDDNSHFYFYK